MRRLRLWNKRVLGRILGIVLICAFSLPERSIAVVPDEHSAMAALQTSLGRLIEAIEDKPDLIDKQSISLLESQIDELQDRIDTGPSPLPSEYISVLQYLADLIDRASQTANSDEARSIVNDVIADLKVKIGKSPFLGIGEAPFKGQVQVTARTLRASKEIPGFIVYANPIRWQGGDPMFSFSKLSSPTSRSLPPGRYEVVISKDGKALARRTFDIGLNREDTAEIDIPVP